MQPEYVQSVSRDKIQRGQDSRFQRLYERRSRAALWRLPGKRLSKKKVEEAVQKLDESKRVSKTDVLSVLKSDFKKHRGGLHAIYSSIVGKEPLDISADECDLALDFASILKFYTQNKEKRIVFSEKYALYYLLKQKGYALELRRDFPDIRSCVNTQNVCDDYFVERKN